jgi:hypothetical protein
MTEERSRADILPLRREVCFIRVRRRWRLRPGIRYEAMTRREGRLEVLARSGPVPADGEAATATRLQLIRELLRDGWLPAPDLQVVGEDVIECYTRAPRRPMA